MSVFFLGVRALWPEPAAGGRLTSQTSSLKLTRYRNLEPIHFPVFSDLS